MRWWRLVVLVAAGGFSSAQADDSLSRLRPFLQKHCCMCHGSRVQKNDLRFDTLGTKLTDRRTLETWQDILDQLNLGEMPPAKAAQPDAGQLAGVIDTLTDILSKAYAEQKSTGAQTVIRRLNRIELRNTLRDLLYLEGPVFDSVGMAKLEDANGNGRAVRKSTDPIRNFPEDEHEQGFDNIGQRLVMSDFLLKLIIAAAEESLAIATHPEQRPKVQTRRFAGHIRTQGPNPGLESWSRAINPDYDAIFQRYREPGASTGGAGRVTANALASRGVGVAARYRITVEASAHNRQHPWGALIRIRTHEPFLLGLHMADARRGGLNEGNPTSRQLTQWALPDDGRVHSYTFETWLDATWTPWLGWENGPYDRALRASTLVQKYLPASWRPKPDNNASRKLKQAYEPEMGAALLKSGYQGPHVRVHSLTVEPLIATWPPRSHEFLYGSGGETAVADRILKFARRAFRRPVEPKHLARYVRLVESQMEQGLSRAEALKTGYTAILASPRFYYLQEQPGRLDNYEIASRLSYFLWSSMPDERLFQLAAAGKLTESAVLMAQVDRMLDDPKAAAFFHRFPQRWLRLDKLGGMPPERSGPFRIYWDRQLESQMVAQTDAFFADLVRRNEPVQLLIDSDYTFMNERVAFLLYGRDDVWGDAFRKVQLNDPRRGGLLTQPSVMTATANGVDTSPVVRGVWLLENVLGTPPAPPPPDVEPLAPDLRGKQTIGEQLRAHRRNATCNACHRKIDPLGFAMENFDPIGRWRDVYPSTRLKVDSAATLVTGERIADIVAFKKNLLARQHQVTRCLCEKMLTYASGRMLEPADRGQVNRIVNALRGQGNGMRDLIRLVVQSDVFLRK